MTETTKTTTIQDMLLATYPVPFMADDFRINLYLYNESNYKELICHDKYFSEIPKDLLAGKALEMDKWCMTFSDEFMVSINEDVCKPEERVAALAECLFHAAAAIHETLQSEEFAARVLGDAFKTMAPLLAPSLATADSSPLRGMDVSVYPFPLKCENYRVTLNMYDESNKTDAMMKLRDKYRDRMITGDLDLGCLHGFVAEPVVDELAVFVQNDTAKDLLMQQTILSHELFHTATNLIRSFDGSEELGARIYRTLFVQFAGAIDSKEKNNDNE